MKILYFIFTFMAVIAMGGALKETGRWSNPVYLIFMILIIAGSIFSLIREFVRVVIRKQSLLNNTEDERTEIIKDKSARNALFATYLVFFIHHLMPGANNIDANWMFYILGSSFIIFIVSYEFYYYRKS